MNFPRTIVALAAAVLALCAGPAAAVVELQKVDWQQAAPSAGAPALSTTTPAPAGSPAKTEILQRLRLSPGDKLPARLGGLVKLLNRGPVAEEGILLRYVVSARVSPTDGGEAAWSLPFVLETRRVPKIGSNQVLEVAIDASTMIDLYLKKLGREGWWLDALKLDVLLEPRKDDPKKLQLLSAELPVERAKR